MAEKNQAKNLILESRQVLGFPTTKKSHLFAINSFMDRVNIVRHNANKIIGFSKFFVQIKCPQIEDQEVGFAAGVTFIPKTEQEDTSTVAKFRVDLQGIAIKDGASRRPSKVICQLFVMASDGSKIPIIPKKEYHLSDPSEMSISSNSFEIAYLEVSNILPSGTLSVVCDMEVSVSCLFPISESSLKGMDHVDSDFLNNLSMAFNKPEFSDVTLTCNSNSRSFFCHKIILASKSTVLEKMLSELPDPKDTLNINLDVVTLQGLLLYIYSDRVVRVSGKLLEAAVAFDLPRLVSTCLVHLPDLLTFENVSDIYDVAVRLQVEDLANICLNFIRQNWSEVVETSGWKNIIEKNVTHMNSIISHAFKTLI